MTEMKVHVLSTGVMETDLTWLLLKGGKRPSATGITRTIRWPGATAPRMQC